MDYSIEFARLRQCALYMLPWAHQSPLHISNVISIRSAVFAGLTVVTDRPIDRQTDHTTPSVAIVRICVVPRCGLKIVVVVRRVNKRRRRRCCCCCHSNPGVERRGCGLDEQGARRGRPIESDEPLTHSPDDRLPPSPPPR